MPITYTVEMIYLPSNKRWRLQQDRTWKKSIDEEIQEGDFETNNFSKIEYYLRRPVKYFNGRVVEWMYKQQQTDWQIEIWEYEVEYE